VEAMSRASESRALEPPRYTFGRSHLWSGTVRYSPTGSPLWGVLTPEGMGVYNGVGAVDAGAGIPSGAIEYTISLARDAIMIHQ